MTVPARRVAAGQDSAAGFRIAPADINCIMLKAVSDRIRRQRVRCGTEFVVSAGLTPAGGQFQFRLCASVRHGAVKAPACMAGNVMPSADGMTVCGGSMFFHSGRGI